ncbi:hypothetical protein [Devosia beringensis]|uniref:hypothetical protein n=1 Tax=Devosia beringensis TaxID=2657486 RepID=UPI00186B8187|nr:hypothetical protein [Devosia beringensis]
MKKFVAVLVALAGLGFGGVMGVAAQEPAQNCTTPGTASLAGIPADPKKIMPNQSRLISGYGRGAKRGTCKISLVCIYADGSDAAREVARQQCVSVRDSLVRGGFTKADISTSRQGPGNGMSANTVYLTAY